MKRFAVPRTKVSDVMYLPQIKFETFRFKKADGTLSNRYIGHEILVSKYSKEFPLGPEIDMSKVQHITEYVDGLLTVVKYVTISLVMNEFWERIKKLCLGCNPDDHTLIKDHSDGCEAPLHTLLDDHLPNARQFVSLDKIVKVISKFSECLGFNFDHEDLRVFVYPILISCTQVDFSTCYLIPELIRTSIEMAEQTVSEEK